MAPLLSVVIPSYNCATLVGTAVRSAYALSSVAMEVIVVDDGSTDDTPAVLATLLDDFPQLRVLRKSNGGLSSARNHGMDHATGQYLVLLDADDELIPCAGLAHLLAGVEMLRLGVQEVTLGDSIKQHAEEVAPMPGRQYLQNCFEARRFYTPSWAYVYQRQWLKQQGLRFQEGLIHEDMLFTVQALWACKTFAAAPDLIYRYIRRPGSLTTAVDEAKILRRVRSLATVNEVLMPLANREAEADVGWWMLHVIDYAATIAQQSPRRMARLLVLAMEVGFLLRYRQWGRFRRVRDVRFRVRKRLGAWANPKIAFLTGVH